MEVVKLQSWKGTVCSLELACESKSKKIKLIAFVV